MGTRTPTRKGSSGRRRVSTAKKKKTAPLSAIRLKLEAVRGSVRNTLGRQTDDIWGMILVVLAILILLAPAPPLFLSMVNRGRALIDGASSSRGHLSCPPRRVLQKGARAVNLKAAVVFCAFALTATPASAQMFGWGPYGAYPAEALSPYSINVRLRANGLRQITQPVQTGRYIVVRAVDPYGSVVRVLFNAHYGNIVSIVPLPPAPIVGEAYGRPYGPYASREPYPRYGAPPADLKVEPAHVGASLGSHYAEPHAAAASAPGSPRSSGSRRPAARCSAGGLRTTSDRGDRRREADAGSRTAGKRGPRTDHHRIGRAGRGSPAARQGARVLPAAGFSGIDARA